MVPRAADALHQQAYRPGRAHLADQVHGPDVYAQLQRRGGDAESYAPLLQPSLGLMARLLREAAVVGDHSLLAEALGHLVGQTLDKAAGVDEEQGCPVILDQVGDAVEALVPLLVGGDGTQLVLWEDQGEVDLSGVSGVHDQAVCGAVARDGVRPNEEPGHLVDGTLGSGEAYARHRAVGQLAEALDGKAQVSASLVCGDGVELVQDQGADSTEALSAAFGGQEDVERLRCSDEYVGRSLGHCLALSGRRIARPHADAYLRDRCVVGFGQGFDPLEGVGEVALDVVGEGLEGRDVDDLGPLGQPSVQACAHQAVETGEEGGQSLARARGRGDEGVSSLGDGRPALGLCLCRPVEAVTEPGLDQRMKFHMSHGQVKYTVRRARSKALVDCRSLGILMGKNTQG